MRFLVTGTDPRSGRRESRTVQANNPLQARNLVTRAGLAVLDIECLERGKLARFGMQRWLGFLLAGGALAVLLLLVGWLAKPGKDAGGAAEPGAEPSAERERTLRTRAAAEQLEAARQALLQGDVETALEHARGAVAQGNVPAAIAAEELVRTIEEPMSPSALARRLAELDETEFAAFADGGSLPGALRTGFPVLDERRTRNARAEVPSAANRRARDPEWILARLSTAGLRTESTWQQLEPQAAHTARAHARRGANSVACELASSDPELVESVHLEVEVVDVYDGEQAALELFARAAASFDASPGLAAAILAARAWHGNGWHLTPQPNRYGNYTLVFSNL